jgi:hypothetical protein
MALQKLLICTKQRIHHGKDPRVNTCLRMIWLCRDRMFLDYKFDDSTDSDCTELLDVLSPADALHISYPPIPFTIYATKQEIDPYWYRCGLIRITEIGEAQVMMEMVKNQYLTNLYAVSTDIERMHMGPEFWYQQHNLDSEAHHLNNHMIDMVQRYMRGDGTRMETCIKLGSMVYKYKHCKGISPEAGWPWKLFNRCMQILMTCLTIPVSAHLKLSEED